MSEPQRDRIVKLKFNCPYCWTSIEMQIEFGIAIFPIEQNCSTETCYGKFKIFNRAEFPSDDKAIEFSRSRYPSIRPRRVFEKGDFWVLVHEYEKVQPLVVSHLTQFIDRDILRSLIYGFGFDLDSIVVILEKIDNKYERIEPIEAIHRNPNPCAIIREHDKGERCCNESVQTLVELNKQRTEPYTKRCWLGLNNRFAPIIIENIVLGTLICADMELAVDAVFLKNTLNRRINDNLPEIQNKSLFKKYESKNGFLCLIKQLMRLYSAKQRQELVSFKEREQGDLEYKEIQIAQKARFINDLAHKSFSDQRREIDGRFIKELSALFDTDNLIADRPYLARASREDKFWELLSHIMRRIAEYLQVEEVHFLVTDGKSYKDSTSLVSKAFSERDSNRIVIGLRGWRKIFRDMENVYYPMTLGIEHDAIGKIIDKASFNLLKPIRNAVICPIDLHENGHAAILMINSNIHAGEYSEEFRRCAWNISTEVAHNVNNALQTMGLEEERHRLKRFIDSTFHTLHQSMYDISMTMQYLELRLEQGKLNKDSIKKTFPEMRRAVTELETKTNLFYGYVNHKKAVYRFDQPFDLKDLINNIIDRFRSTAAKREITIELEFHPDLIYVFWDKQHIDVLLSNLLHNAIKYSHHKKPVNLTVNYDKAFGLVILEIRNYGFGIPREELDKIFGYGFRSTLQDPRRPIPGAGLGLYMAREIVLRHHGAIEAKSIRDNVTHSIYEDINWEGFLTIFRIELPIKIDEQEGRE